MGSKKNETRNEVGWSSPPSTQATTALQGMVDTPVDYSTVIRNSYARAKQGLSRSYANPLGGYTTADVKDKSLRSQNRDLDQSLGIDLSNAAQQSGQDKFNRQAQVASLTSPQLYNKSSYQPWGVTDTLGLGTSLASGALT